MFMGSRNSNRTLLLLLLLCIISALHKHRMYTPTQITLEQYNETYKQENYRYTVYDISICSIFPPKRPPF